MYFEQNFNAKINFVKIEFENSIIRLSFLCHLTDIKIAWMNPWHKSKLVQFTLLHVLWQFSIKFSFSLQVCNFVPLGSPESSYI